MGSSRKKTLALILTTAIVLTAQPIAVYAEEAEKDEKIEEEVSTITNIMNTGNRDATYSAYFEKHGSKNHPRKEIVIEAGAADALEEAMAAENARKNLSDTAEQVFRLINTMSKTQA